MQTLRKQDFSAGWIASDDAINGRKNGLLRMDNLTLDEGGIVSLVRGTQKVSNTAFGSQIDTIYSRYINSKKLRYVAEGGTVKRNYGAGNSEIVFDVNTVTGQPAGRAVFGTGFGHNFINLGAAKKKDNGTNLDSLLIAHPEGFNIGVPTPSAPTLAVQAPPSKDVSFKDGATNMADWEAFENGVTYNDAGGYVWIDNNATTLRGIAQVGRTVAVTLNTLSLSSGTGNDEDIFSMNVRVSEPNKLVKIILEFLLEIPEAPGAPVFTATVSNYYWFEWNARATSSVFSDPANPDNLPYDITPAELERLRNEAVPDNIILETLVRSGPDGWTNFNCKRGQFRRVGNDDAKDWTVVKGVRVIFVGTDGLNIAFRDLKFEGGSSGPLTGFYKYRQVDCYQNDDYLSQSKGSVESAEVFVRSASIQVTYAVTSGTQVNRVRFYRAGGNTQGYYLVKEVDLTSVATGSYNFVDALSDTDAILDRTIENTFNPFREVSPNFTDIACQYFERNLYLTDFELIASVKNDPDTYDTRHTIKICGNQGEFNLFIAKVASSVLLIGTTNDIYEVTGDFAEIEIDTGITILDTKIRALGIKRPPVSRAYTVEGGALIYLAEDGWRILAGSQSDLLTGETWMLYNKSNRHGVPYLSLPITDNVNIYCGITKGKFYASMFNISSEYMFHIYDFKTKTWQGPYRNTTYRPKALYIEEDGTILVGTDSSGDKFLRIFDTGTLVDGVSNQAFQFLTTFDDGGTPNNRKDSSTLVLEIDTGGVAIDININAYTDSSVYAIAAYSQAFSGRTVVPFNLNLQLPSPVLKYQIAISGTVPVFKFYDGYIYYDLRPVRLAFIKIPPNNFGIANKKRIRTLPLVLDSLGSNVTYTPEVDGVLIPSQAQVINTSTKRTVLHHFTTDQFGIDFGGTLSGGPFEFYELLKPENVQSLPVPKKFDQLGPVEFNKIGKVKEVRLRLVPTGTLISYNIYSADTIINSGSFVTVANKEDVYTIKLIKSINPTICRVELSSPNEFHRYPAEFMVHIEGAATSFKRLKVA